MDNNHNRSKIWIEFECFVHVPRRHFNHSNTVLKWSGKYNKTRNEMSMSIKLCSVYIKTSGLQITWRSTWISLQFCMLTRNGKNSNQTIPHNNTKLTQKKIHKKHTSVIEKSKNLWMNSIVLISPPLLLSSTFSAQTPSHGHTKKALNV